MNDFLDIIYKEIKNIDSVSDDLDYYANALQITGNDKLSNVLFELSYLLKQSIKNIDNCTAEKINEDYIQSMNNSKELMSGILQLALNKK